MSKLVVGNWKMNPQTYAEAKNLAREVGRIAGKYEEVQVAVCPPFVWLADISAKKEKSLEYGAQDVFWMDGGAYTGEVSPMMLKNSGIKYVILGHSERRKLGETDKEINLKVKAVLTAGLAPILCVGEDAKTHRKGTAQVLKFVEKQLRDSLREVPGSVFRGNRLVVAYEPVWAISTNPGAKPDNPEQASATIYGIRKILASMFRAPGSMFRVLYGGSVNAGNAEGFLFCPEISGVLVGGASLKPKDFGEIIKVAQKTNKNKDGKQ